MTARTEAACLLVLVTCLVSPSSAVGGSHSLPPAFLEGPEAAFVSSNQRFKGVRTVGRTPCSRCARNQLVLKAGGKGQQGGKRDIEMEKAVKTLKQMEARKEKKTVFKANRREAEAVAAQKPPKHVPAPFKAKGPVNPFMKDKVTSSFNVKDIAGIDFLGSFGEEVSTWPKSSLPEIAFLGRSNVGKSSMLNALFGEKVARTSKMPGRTQAVNLFSAKDKNGRETCWFADLPGYGFAKIGQDKQKEIELILERYMRLRTNLKLLILLVDPRREPLAVDEGVIAFVADNNLPFRLLVVATKADKLSPMETALNFNRIRDAFDLPDGMPLQFSAVTNKGKNELWQFIKEACEEV